MKATYFVAVFASVAAAATTNMNAAAAAAEMQNANMRNAEVYARQADGVGDVVEGAGNIVGGATGALAAADDAAADAAATFESLFGLVDKILTELGEKVPELKEPAKKVSDAIADFAEAAKDVDFESITEEADAN